MYRILHLSDLHLSRSRWSLEDLLDPFGRTGLEVVERLRLSCRKLRPNAVIVTGDLTDFGDTKSLEDACELLEVLKEESNAETVLCIPGNHDLYDKRFLTFFRVPFANPLANYRTAPGERYGRLLPGFPAVIDTVWGQIAFFLFDSCDPKYRDEGHISDDQQIGLVRHLEETAGSEDWLRVALVHHHPAGAPSEELGLQQKLIQMRDGPEFLQNLERLGFHLILHGHQHVPFSWVRGAGQPLNVVSAGSALLHRKRPASFNVIDFLSPFAAETRRYDFDENDFSGFGEVEDARETLELFDVKMRLEELNTEPGPPGIVNPRDAAAINLRTVERKGIEHDHAYERLEYVVVIQGAPGAEHYYGRYRRIGRVVAEESDGWLYVLTGEPATRVADLELQLTDSKGNNLQRQAAEGARRKHIIRALPMIPLSRGDEFDITMGFHWPTASHDPNDYDGFNLLYFQHQVQAVYYEVELPWKPAQLLVWSCGARVKREKVRWNQNGQKYSFEIKRPLHAPYLIQIGERPI